MCAMTCPSSCIPSRDRGYDIQELSVTRHAQDGLVIFVILHHSVDMSYDTPVLLR